MLKIKKLLKITVVCVSALVVLFSFTCCATLRPSHLNHHEQHYRHKTAAGRAKQLLKIKQWSINGSFLVQFPDPQSSTHALKAEMARFTWQQSSDPQTFTVTINANFNVASVVIRSTPSGVTLVTGKNHLSHSYTSVEALTQDQFGFTLPFSNLYYWIRGLPTTDTTKDLDNQYDQYGHLIITHSGDWTASLLAQQYVSTPRGDLPLKIKIKNTKKRLFLVIKSSKDGWESVHA